MSRHLCKFIIFRLFSYNLQNNPTITISIVSQTYSSGLYPHYKLNYIVITVHVPEFVTSTKDYQNKLVLIVFASRLRNKLWKILNVDLTSFFV